MIKIAFLLLGISLGLALVSYIFALYLFCRINKLECKLIKAKIELQDHGIDLKEIEL